MQSKEIFTANIVCEHLDFLAEAAHRGNVTYRLGSQMTFNSRGEVRFDFVPVFCDSVQDARALQESFKAVLAAAEKVPLPGRDSMVLLPRG